MSGPRQGVTLGKFTLSFKFLFEFQFQFIILFLFLKNSQTEQALSDLNEAMKVAPPGRDVRKVLLKAIEETESAQRLPGTSTLALMEPSSDTIQDCCSSGVGSSLTSTSERG